MEDSVRNAEIINFVPKKVETKKESGGFKLLEILVILSAFVVIGLLVLLAVNPNKEAAEARNVKRIADVSSILTMVSSYARQYGEIPEVIPVNESCVYYGNEICKSGPYDCTDLVKMSAIYTEDDGELVVIPEDPLYISINGTGYYIAQGKEGLVTVCAPHAERNEKISFSKLMY